MQNVHLVWVFSLVCELCTEWFSTVKNTSQVATWLDATKLRVSKSPFLVRSTYCESVDSPSTVVTGGTIFWAIYIGRHRLPTIPFHTN